MRMRLEIVVFSVYTQLTGIGGNPLNLVKYSGKYLAKYFTKRGTFQRWGVLCRPVWSFLVLVCRYMRAIRNVLSVFIQKQRERAEVRV